MWHFSKLDRRLRYSDDRLIVAGETLTTTNRPIHMCNYGMHASESLIDAISYAPGCYVWAVEMGSDVITEGDKSVSSSRKAVWGYDATKILREFARIVALESLEKYYDEIKYGKLDPVIVEFLKTGDRKLAYAAVKAAYAASKAAAYAVKAAYAASKAAANAANAAYAAANAAYAAANAAANAANAAANAANAAANAANAANAAANAANAAANAANAANAAANTANAAAPEEIRQRHNELLEKMILEGRP